YGTGYRGRRGLFALLGVNEEIRSHINRGDSVSVIRRAAKSYGMRSLAEEGQRLIGLGLVDNVEVHRVVQGCA
ncbi:MAG: type II secretion system protein GspE, partial [Acidimicrobiia bacterium]|nr:type II secretion system protein GspE [Acidimicrobiia bacterium]